MSHSHLSVWSAPTTAKLVPESPATAPLVLILTSSLETLASKLAPIPFMEATTSV